MAPLAKTKSDGFSGRSNGGSIRMASTPFAVDTIRGAQDAAWQRGMILLTVNTNNAKGIPCVALTTGMVDEHATTEHIAIDDLVMAAKILFAIVTGPAAD